MNLNDDVKYRDLINTLNRLQKVKAPESFGGELMRKINSGKIGEEKTFWQKLILPSRLIPSAALAVTAIVLIFVLNNNGITQDNPLLAPPRKIPEAPKTEQISNTVPEVKAVRKDRVSSEMKKTEVQRSNDKLEEGISLETTAPVDESSKPSVAGNLQDNAAGNGVHNAGRTGRIIPAGLAVGRASDSPVSKTGLNFRQIKISNEQKIELDKMKQKLDSTFNAGEKK